MSKKTEMYVLIAVVALVLYRLWSARSVVTNNPSAASTPSDGSDYLGDAADLTELAGDFA